MELGGVRMNGSDDAARVVTAKLSDDTLIRVELAKSGTPGGMQSAGLGDLDLDGALATIGHVGSAVVEKLKAAAPTRATVELKFGFAVEAGKLTALWIGGKGEASLTVTLEWSKDSTGEISGGKKADDKQSDDNGGSDD